METTTLKRHPDFPAAFIRRGWGFDVSQDFARAVVDTPIRIAPSEYAKPGHLIGYIAANPASSLGFLKYSSTGEIRVHVQQSAIGGLPDDSPPDLGDESEAVHDPRD